MSDATTTPKGFVIFTDGAAKKNPGPGGWGVVLAWPDDRVIEMGGGEGKTTNNRMEMMAAIQALEAIADDSGAVILHTDSTYLSKGITSWISGWKRRGWQTAGGDPVLNQDLWQRLDALVAERGRSSITWKKVPGHAGVPGNERADEIADGFAVGRPPELWAGRRDDYPVDLSAVTAASAGKAGGAKAGGRSQSRGKGKAAYSYLSAVDGEVRRHRSWPACQARVQGVPKARFKKALSRADELAILRQWGFSPDDL